MLFNSELHLPRPVLPGGFPVVGQNQMLLHVQPGKGTGPSLVYFNPRHLLGSDKCALGPRQKYSRGTAARAMKQGICAIQREGVGHEACSQALGSRVQLNTPSPPLGALVVVRSESSEGRRFRGSVFVKKTRRFGAGSSYSRDTASRLGCPFLEGRSRCKSTGGLEALPTLPPTRCSAHHGCPPEQVLGSGAPGSPRKHTGLRCTWQCHAHPWGCPLQEGTGFGL